MKLSIIEPCYSSIFACELQEDYKYEDPWSTCNINAFDTRSCNDFTYNTYVPMEQNYQNLSDEEQSFADTIASNKIRPQLVEDWSAYHIMAWIIELYENEGFSYEPVNMHLLRNYNGSELLNLPESKFYEIHESKARWLYQKVRELANKSDYSDSNYNIYGRTDVPFTTGSDCETEPLKQKRRGRPRTLNKIRRKSDKTGRLWEFLRDLLLNPEYCPSLICWENHEEGTFRFVCSDKVAKIWGSKRGNTEMNYEKLSRAMRYYYRNKVLQPVLGKRLVYKFGPNAAGWRTNNPNFKN